MAAPKGNQYWKLAHDWKKPKRYKSGELLEKAKEYAEWCERYPLYELKVFGTGIKMRVPKMRAMTIQGFCLFCNMASSTWYKYEKQKGYSEIVSCVKGLFYSQKFEGAAAEFLNPNLIARELGLAEKQDVKNDIKGEITIIRRIITEKKDGKD